MTLEKIPFKKELADNTLLIFDLLIKLTKENNDIMTLEQLIITQKYFKKLYYNKNVELLEVLE